MQFKFMPPAEIAIHDLAPKGDNAVIDAERADRAYRELEPGQPDQPPADAKAAYDQLAPDQPDKLPDDVSYEILERLRPKDI